MRRIFQEEGIKGYYRGFGATLFATLPANMAFFGAYQSSKQIMMMNVNMPDMLVQVISGLIAGFTSAIISTPLDFLKTRIQLQAGKKKIGRIFLEALKEGGMGGLFRGMMPRLIALTPMAGLNFIIFEKVKQLSLKG
jgi:hypothetical protein